MVAFALTGALLLLLEVKMASASCISASDVGTGLQCIEAPGIYTRAQWATCLTNTYIQQVSKGKHICRDAFATLCYYQCQLEVHGEESGDVSDDCACRDGDTAPQQPGVLDPSCYSPSGENCTWYSDCLEKRYPCQGGQAGYAVEYAEQFCNKYVERRLEFSDLGQRWMDAVRKCLQVKLAPTLRPFEQYDCASIKARAFASHEGCYLSPYQGAPSVCDLPPGDWWSIFWTIKGAYVSETRASLYGMYQVLGKCGSRVGSYFYQLGKDAVGTLMLKIELALSNSLVATDGDGVTGRRRRQASDDSAVPSDLEMRYLELAQQVGEGVAPKLGWSQKGLVWFAFAEPSPDRTSLTTSLFLADQRQYGLLPGNSSTNLTAVVVEFADAFQSGRLNGIRLDGTLVQLLTMSVCDDADCQQVSLNATAPTNGSGNTCEPVLKMLLALVWMTIVLK